MIMCGMATLLCVEVARPRREQRFVVHEPVTLAIGGTALLSDISVSGARFAIDDPPSELTFSWRGVSDVSGLLVRKGPGWGSYSFTLDERLERALTIDIYAGGFRSSAVTFDLPSFFMSVGRRLLLRSAPA